MRNVCTAETDGILAKLTHNIGLKLATLHSMAVDYVKTGEPARMPSDLNPRKWPHFMEKNHKPKEQIYVSHKVLGKLYDQVERIDFVPLFDSPFDNRILGAYKLDEKLLWDAATVKEQYDAAMRRIMAQHDIATEFEVWSTFVLHHANQSKDYKFHEEMGQISSALKDRFRQACYDKAGSKDLQVMGPFVAAMYNVTAEEMAYAVEECRQVKIVGGQETKARHMVAKSMPLMSFPWLFQSILGKIACGEVHMMDQGNIDTHSTAQSGTKRYTPKDSATVDIGLSDQEDTLATTEGFTHRGEILELFHHDEEQLRHTDPEKQGFSEGPESRKSSIEVVTKANGNSGRESHRLLDDFGESLVNLSLDQLPEVSMLPRGVDFGTLIDIDDGTNTKHRTPPLAGNQTQKGSSNLDDLLGDDADVEQFNVNTAYDRENASSDTALGTASESESTEGSISYGDGTLVHVYHDDDSELLARLNLDEAETGEVDDKLPLDEDEDDDDGQGEEVTIRIDTEDSALESLAKLVG